MIDVQRQKGTCDCGLFAVAFATALANGIQPERLEFEQDRMRKHLYRCFNQDALSMFPASRREPQATVQSTDIKEIYCTCRMPECRLWLNVPIAASGTTLIVFMYQK